MAEWPATPTLIGKRIPRLDGLLKASGKAKYPSDVRPEGTLFGVMLYSPYAHAKVKSIDISAAEKMPGVKAVIAIAKAGATLRYHGDDIAAVAAETEEQARDAIRAIKVEYEVLPHVATEALSMAEGAPEVFKGGNVRKGRSADQGQARGRDGRRGRHDRGDVLGPDDHPRLPRVPRPDRRSAKATTSSPSGRAPRPSSGMARRPGGQPFKIPPANVTVLTDYMGGGFGSKFGADIWGMTAAQLSKMAGGGRSRCSSTACRSTSPRATAPARRPTSRWGPTATARSSP